MSNVIEQYYSREQYRHLRFPVLDFDPDEVESTVDDPCDVSKVSWIVSPNHDPALTMISLAGVARACCECGLLGGWFGIRFNCLNAWVKIIFVIIANQISDKEEIQ